MQEKQVHHNKNRAAMIRYNSHKQLTLAELDWPFQTALYENNRRVKLSQCIPRDELLMGITRDSQIVRAARLKMPGW